MPDTKFAPAAKRFDPDELDTPVAVAALDAIDQYVRGGHANVDVGLAKARIAALRAYLHILEEEMETEVTRLLSEALVVRVVVPS